MKNLIGILIWFMIILSGCQLLENIKQEAEADPLEQFIEDKAEQLAIQSEDKETVLIPEPVKTVPVEEIKLEPSKENDMSDVDECLAVDVRGWAVTCNVSAWIKGDTLIIKADQIPDNWPVFEANKKMCVATVGIIITVDGKTYASTCEFTKGTGKEIPLSKLGEGESGASDHLQGYGKLKGWVLKKGDTIGFIYIANNVRANQTKIKERSSVAWVTIN